MRKFSVLSNLIFEMLRSDLRLLDESKTPRLSDLTRDDLILVIEDILGREPLASYTEKLAGQNLTVYIENEEVLGQYKGKEKGSWADLSGVASTIRNSPIPSIVKNGKFSFEILKPENRPDYIDYAIGNSTFVVEFGGELQKNHASILTKVSRGRLKFLTKEDITKRPMPLSAMRKQQMESFLEQLLSNKKVSKDLKTQIEASMSEALVEIFGESIFGGSPEGIFVTGASKGFKIPEKSYADLQKLQAPLFAILSSKRRIPYSSIVERFQGVAQGTVDPSKDRMVLDVVNYLKAASAGFTPGFKTFFSPPEAKSLLKMFDNVAAGDVQMAGRFISTLSNRIDDKRSWVSTRDYTS